MRNEQFAKSKARICFSRKLVLLCSLLIVHCSLLFAQDGGTRFIQRLTWTGDEYSHHFAFADNRLTSIAIPYGVTSIGQEAFARNQLSSVVIPGSVTKIGNQAFAGNLLNGNVTIPDGSAIEIGDRAFENEYIDDWAPGG